MAPDPDAGRPHADELRNELEFLRQRLAALELKSQAEPGEASGGPAPIVPDQSGQIPQEPTPGLLSRMQQQKEMEECLYRHRKAWEEGGGPGRWWLRSSQREMLPRTPHRPPGPWIFDWNIFPQRQFVRPDPFDPEHRCAPESEAKIPGTGAEDDPLDDFDDTIEYGAHRERLRKNFEWDLDRLFVAEEIGRRRRAAKVAKKAEVKPADAKSDGKEKAGSLARHIFDDPQLSRADWYSFRRNRRDPTDSMEPASPFIVEVLVGEPILDDDYGGQTWYGSTRPRHDKTPGRTAVSSESEPGRLPLPERIRISSPVLLQILDQLLKDEKSPFSPLGAGRPIQGDYVFTRPFKALLYCEEALRNWCAALERKFHVVVPPHEAEDGGGEPAESVGSAAAVRLADSDERHVRDEAARVPVSIDVARPIDEATNPSGQGGPDDADDPTTSTTALRHLRCFLAFFDSDLRAKRDYLKEFKSRKVAFSDLWHLFRPGMEVVRRDGLQAYRVVQVSSAKHRRLPTSWWEAGADVRGEKPAFSIACVHVDFDGKELGPVLSTFKFKRYEEERDITSFEVYPLRFHPAKQADFTTDEWAEVQSLAPSLRFRDKLIRRGMKFVNVSTIKHMYYAGPTADGRDEVESQVVVDAETALSLEDPTRRLKRPGLEVMSRYLTGNVLMKDTKEDGKAKSDSGSDDSDSDDGDDGLCLGRCCAFESVHDDSYVDKRQSVQYLQSLFPSLRDTDAVLSVVTIPRPAAELGSIGPPHFTEDELVIMSYRVFGFVLRSRKWAPLNLSYLTDVHASVSDAAGADDHADKQQDTKKKSPTTFDRLVLEEGHKPMILSLIAQHFRDKASGAGDREQVDIVRGKGMIQTTRPTPAAPSAASRPNMADIHDRKGFDLASPRSSWGRQNVHS